MKCSVSRNVKKQNGLIRHLDRT